MKKENLNEQLNQCHSGLDPESHEMLNQVQHDRIMEQGRSMVEMLGVLAIIGVLTIIGIAGFRLAMNKHYANQTVNRLMKRAVVVAAQANFGQTLSLHEFDENDGEYKITLLDPTNNESFTMQVEDIPQEVCQQILGMDWKLAKMNPDNCSEETINFMFLNELTDCSTCVPDSVDCPPESEMQCGKCSVVKGFMDNNDDCEGNENGTQCVRGKCSMCTKGTYANNSNNCVPCVDDGNYYYAASELYKHHCLETMFYRLTSHKQIFSCSYPNTVNTSDELSCKSCKNRCYYATDGLCRNPETEEAGLKRNADGNCECKNGHYLPISNGSLAYCTLCVDDGNVYYATPESRHNCLKKMFFRTSHNQMIACSWTGKTDYGADERSCKECNNRCYLNGTCQLYGSGQTYLYKDADGNCTNTPPN